MLYIFSIIIYYLYFANLRIIAQVNEDSSIAVQLASKKDKNIIKDLRQTLKTETMKLQQMKAQNLQLKDELNDLRDWRENYLRQQKLEQISSSSSQENHNNNNNNNNNESRESSQENKVNEDIADNISTSSSASNQTSSSKNSKSSKNHITVKQKVNIMKMKSRRAIDKARSNMPLPSFGTILSNEFGGDDEKMHPQQQENQISNITSLSSSLSSSNDFEKTKDKQIIGTKEHDEVIEALSDRLAIVKENYMNLKNVVSNKEKEIDKLNFELEKKKEMVADLIEKLIDKPLPPTPTQLAKLEQAENEYKKCEVQSDEDKVLMNLEEQGLSGPINRKPIIRHVGNSKQLLHEINKPPIPSEMPPPLSSTNPLPSINGNQRPPPTRPPPKVVVSPSYNKGIGQNSHFPFQQNEEIIMQNQVKKAKENCYINNSKQLKQIKHDEIKPLINDDDDQQDIMNADGI